MFVLSEADVPLTETCFTPTASRQPWLSDGRVAADEAAKRLNGYKMEVLREPGAARRVSTRRLVCLLACLPSDFNPAWRGKKTAHYGKVRFSPRDEISTRQQRDKQLLLQEAEDDGDAWTRRFYTACERIRSCLQCKYHCLFSAD